MKNFRIPNPEIRVTPHEKSTTIEVKANTLDTLKEIGHSLGITYRVNRDERIHIVYDKSNKPIKLVLEEDISYHGSPCWDTKRVLTEDPVQIEAYLNFKKLIELAYKLTENR